MRKRYKKRLMQRINKRVMLLTVGALALLLLLFFASFWITTSILKSGWETPIPRQSDFATSSPDAQPEDDGTDIHKEDNKKASPVSEIEDGHATATKKPEAASSAPAAAETAKPSEKPEKTEAPKASKQPEAPSAKPTEAPKATETPKPTAAPTATPAPSKTPLPIIAPNAGEAE